MKEQEPMTKNKIYLAGPWDSYADNWKTKIKKGGLNYYDPQIDSNQTSSETFFPDDLRAIREADKMVVFPSDIPAEAAWFEMGYFYATHAKDNEKLDSLIVIWKEDREPRWALKFLKMAGHIVSSIEEANKLLNGEEVQTD
jgi:hypothetical protein